MNRWKILFSLTVLVGISFVSVGRTAQRPNPGETVDGYLERMQSDGALLKGLRGVNVDAVWKNFKENDENDRLTTAVKARLLECGVPLRSASDKTPPGKPILFCQMVYLDRGAGKTLRVAADLSEFAQLERDNSITVWHKTWEIIRDHEVAQPNFENDKRFLLEVVDKFCLDYRFANSDEKKSGP